ncbi:unnamed protein product [Rangifer tarandus platyrhynchus]|uniref:Secreted protein n=1 Tax=Rangifer tarandus platyrhynchus TaxID=3082113 RepID=A0ABN9A4C1_RANTA|nr:unnamed protein product [Rangifer tarandus platyrhynchus]
MQGRFAIALFLCPSPRSPTSFPLDPGNPNKSVSKFRVLFRVFCPTRCADPNSQSPFPQARKREGRIRCIREIQLPVPGICLREAVAAPTARGFR